MGVLLDTRPFNFYDDKYKNLKVISRVGVGMDNVDLEGAKERGIKVYGTPCEELTQSVAEFTVLQILKFFRYHRRMLKGNIIGIIGYGRIGSKIEYLLSGYAKEFFVYDKKHEGTTGMASKEVVLENSDVVIIAVSGKEEIIGKEETPMLKPGVVLVNIARKECVDETAILDGLHLGTIYGFVSDVNNDFLITDHNLLLTPHIASDTIECRKAMELTAVENLRKGLGG